MKLKTADDLLEGLHLLKKEILSDNNPDNLLVKLLIAKGFNYQDMFNLFKYDNLEDFRNYNDDIRNLLVAREDKDIREFLFKNKMAESMYGHIADMSILEPSGVKNHNERLNFLMEKIDNLGPKYDFLNVCFWGIQMYKGYLSSKTYLECYEKMGKAIVENMETVRLTGFSLTSKKKATFKILPKNSKYYDVVNDFLNADFGKVTIKKNWDSVSEFEILKNILIQYRNKVNDEINKHFKEHPYKSFYIERFQTKSISFAGFNKLEEKLLKQQSLEHSNLNQIEVEKILEGLAELSYEKETCKDVFSYYISEEKERLIKSKDKIVILMNLSGSKSQVIQMFLKRKKWEYEDYEIKFNKVSDKLLTFEFKDKTEDKKFIKIEGNVANTLNRLVRNLYENLNKEEDFKIKAFNRELGGGHIFQNFLMEIRKHINTELLITSLEKEFDKKTINKKKI